MRRTVILATVVVVTLVAVPLQALPNAPALGSSGADEGWPSPSSAGVRPGVDIGGNCTANFLFSDPTNTTFYIGTAAHCVDNHAIGDLIRINHGQAIGVLVYSGWKTLDDGGTGRCDFDSAQDFALVRIKDQYEDNIHPAMLAYGGPTHMQRLSSIGDKVLTYGDSPFWAGVDTLQMREGYVVSPGLCITDIYTAGPGLPGDSGSPVVLEEGGTVGVLTTLQFAPEAGSNGVVTLDQAVAFMEKNTALDVELKTWKVFNDGVLPGT